MILSQLYDTASTLEEELSSLYEPKKDELLQRTKQDIQELELERARGTIFRTRSKWQIEGERNMAYFYGLEKSSQQPRHAM